MLDFEEYLSHVLDKVAPSQIKEAMQYSLMAGGKRIRPRLLFATLEAYGIERHLGFGAAAAIEMIHTYSLIHDDLPAMDNDTLRRGLPTCHVKFGEAIAILAGDALLTQAFAIAADATNNLEINSKIVKALVEYSGANGMVLGQEKDLEGEANPNIELAQLQEIHIYKTGKLLTLPFLFAAYIAKQEQSIATWQKIGRAIGLSFQIQDDILDITSTVQELGKNINSDQANDKTTYVSLLGIEQATADALALFQEAQDALHTLQVNEAPITEVFDLLIRRKK